MGGACNCMTDKQEKACEIGTDTVKPIEKLDKCTQSETVSTPTVELVLKQPIETKVKTPITLPEITPDPYSPLIQSQSIFRGYLTRKTYTAFQQLKPQSISEVPASISTFEAKQAYSRLAPFKFEKHSGDEGAS